MDLPRSSEQSVFMNLCSQSAPFHRVARPAAIVLTVMIFLPFPAHAQDGTAQAGGTGQPIEYADNSILNILESIGGNFIRRNTDQRHEVDERDAYRREEREYERNYERRSSTAADVQYALARRGYYRGPIDGAIGRQSRNAIANYQRDQGLAVTGNINSRLLRALGVR